jgi:serine/threonine protein kinase
MLIEANGHPNIIKFQGLFLLREAGDETRVSLCTEMGLCGDLLSRVLGHGRINEYNSKPIFHGMMSAIAHIHALDMLHRDVKAENILLRSPDVAVLADFGLATKSHDAVQMARRCGSPGYVAPEVCLGTSPYGPKVDCFGAGVVLFFMLSKGMPFSSQESDTATLMRRTVRCNLRLRVEPFDSMTGNVRSLLRGLICRDTDVRLSSAATLEHPWLTALTDHDSDQQASRSQQDSGHPAMKYPSNYQAKEVEQAQIQTSSSSQLPFQPPGQGLSSGEDANHHQASGMCTSSPQDARGGEIHQKSGAPRRSPSPDSAPDFAASGSVYGLGHARPAVDGSWHEHVHPQFRGGMPAEGSRFAAPFPAGMMQHSGFDGNPFTGSSPTEQRMDVAHAMANVLQSALPPHAAAELLRLCQSSAVRDDQFDANDSLRMLQGLLGGLQWRMPPEQTFESSLPQHLPSNPSDRVESSRTGRDKGKGGHHHTLHDGGSRRSDGKGSDAPRMAPACHREFTTRGKGSALYDDGVMPAGASTPNPEAMSALDYVMRGHLDRSPASQATFGQWSRSYNSSFNADAQLPPDPHMAGGYVPHGFSEQVLRGGYPQADRLPRAPWFLQPEQHPSHT